MRESFSCACTVMDGKLKLFNRELLDRALFDFPNGIDLELVIQEPKQQRSNAQNRFFHGPVCDGFLHADLGYRNTQEVKDMLALLFIPQEIKLMDGSVIRAPGHTSALTVKEFNVFIEQCIQCAAENDIEIKDSDQWRRDHSSEAA